MVPGEVVLWHFVVFCVAIPSIPADMILWNKRDYF